ncbi:MAG: hypothetical protein AB7M05_05465 [Alphaproteobacteria bacterium]
MKKIVSGFIALAVLAGGASLAQAQINPFGRWAQPGLTKEEASIVQKTAQSVYRNPDVKPGDRAEWSYKKTGNSGWVEATKLFDYKDAKCIETLYGFKIKEAEMAQNTLTINHCKMPDGSWKIL